MITKHRGDLDGPQVATRHRLVITFAGPFPIPGTPLPEPAHPSDPMGGVDSSVWETAQDQWMLISGIILLVLATLILAISLFLPETQAVLSNGILMGGVFTMLYAVGMTVSAATSWLRLAVVTAALAITIAVGYMKFTRGHKKDSLPVAASSGATVLAGTVQDTNLDVRLTAVETKLNALGDALRR